MILLQMQMQSWHPSSNLTPTQFFLGLYKNIIYSYRQEVPNEQWFVDFFKDIEI